MGAPKTPRLKDRVAAGECVLAPGVYDCLGAKLAVEAGFDAVSISGYGVEAAQFGLPDLGYAGLFDMVAAAGRIVQDLPVPVICDADTGYGGPPQVREVTRRLERLGVQALHIEDQAAPKRCGGLPGRRVIPVEEMCEKVRAATQAREGDDLLVIARTDAKSAEGLQASAERLNRYFDAGADLVFAAENHTPEELEELCRRVEGPLAICGGVPGWTGSFETAETYRALGVRLVIYPFTSLFVAARAMREFYAAMRAQGGVTPAAAEGAMTTFDWFSDFIGVGRAAEVEAAARDDGKETG